MKELKPFYEKSGGTVVELGSRDGHDARRMAEIFKADRVITIEANPDCHKDILLQYPEFENYNVAINNKSGLVDFWQVDHGCDPVVVGQSSLLKKPDNDSALTKIQVQGLTMDEFVERSDISEIEALKIDVEGATYEVLEGFSKIRMTRLLHIESEHKEIWQGQSLYEDTADFMYAAGYRQVYFQQVWQDQSDSIWMRM